MDLNEIKLQYTIECRQQWRAKCSHVRNGGLLTTPPPTTMIMPESNTTSILWTTSKDDATTTWYTRLLYVTRVTTIIASPNVDGITLVGSNIKQDDELINETNVTTEFDDSPEADTIRKCDESDRTGDIPWCTWVRNINSCAFFGHFSAREVNFVHIFTCGHGIQKLSPRTPPKISRRIFWCNKIFLG